MERGDERSPSSYATAALRAADSGVFEWNLREGRIYGCRGVARLFGLSEVEARAGVTVKRLAAAVHIEDRVAFLGRAERRPGRHGLAMAEYRTMPRPGHVHWLLERGRYEEDAAGEPVVRRGIILDVTAAIADRTPQASALSGALMADSPLDEVAAHAVAARTAIDRLEDAADPSLRQAVDGLLWAVGRALARRQTR